MTNRHINAYRQTEIQSRTPLELVVMLYDGALRFLTDASAAAARNDRRARAEGVSKALAIVCELQNTLNVEAGGEIARQLDGLYGYMTSRLLDATAKRDDAALGEVHRLLSTLRDGWAEIASQAAPTKVAV
jgi:flagellar secretion chaperone FliS